MIFLFSFRFSGYEPCSQLTKSMNVLNFGTFCLIVFTLNPRFSCTLNDTIGATTTSPRIRHQLHIAGFFNLASRNGAGSLEAARMAVEEINSDSRYLDDYEIELHQQRSTQVQESYSFYGFFFQGQVGFQFNQAVPFVFRSLLKVLKQVVEITCD